MEIQTHNIIYGIIDLLSEMLSCYFVVAIGNTVDVRNLTHEFEHDTNVN